MFQASSKISGIFRIGCVTNFKFTDHSTFLYLQTMMFGSPAHIFPLVMLFLAFSIESLNGHSIRLTQPRYCTNVPGKTLAVGSIIMNQPAIAEPAGGRTMIISRNGITLSSGSFYVPGEQLQVTVSTFSLDVAIQASGQFYN